MHGWTGWLAGASRLGSWAIGLLGSNAGLCRICGRHRGDAVNSGIGKAAGASGSGRRATVSTTGVHTGLYAAAAGAHAARMCQQALCGRCWEAIPWVEEHRCLVCGRSEACEDCSRRKQASFLMNRSAVRYDASMKQWLARYKYRGDERLGQLLAGMLCPAYEQLVAELASEAGGKRSRRLNWDVVTYVPVSRERAQERGFNQSEQFASAIAERYRLPFFPLLARLRDTGKQSFKSRAQRLQSLEGMFASLPDGIDRLAAQHTGKAAALQEHQSKPQRRVNILLVDDVYTTGATVEWCSRTLAAACEQQGFQANIVALTWARS